MADRLTVGRVEINVGGPMPPPRNRGLETVIELRRAHRSRRIVIERSRFGVGQRQVRPLPAPDLEGCDKVVIAFAGQRAIRPDDKRVAASHGTPDAVAAVTQPGPDFAVVEANGHPQPQLHAPANSFDDAQQLAMGISFSSLAHDKAVEDLGFATGCSKRRL
jgi:hypothetical protein